MFPSDAHPGRVIVGRGSERGSWNDAGKSSAPAAKEEVVVACFKGEGKGERGEMESPRRGEANGARIWVVELW